MDRNEKKRLRDRIGEYMDVSATRLTDQEALELAWFVDDYDQTYRGTSHTRTRSRDGWSSDGRYTRHETLTETFTDEIGIRFDYVYQDDDGQSGESSEQVTDARRIIDYLRDRR